MFGKILFTLFYTIIYINNKNETYNESPYYLLLKEGENIHFNVNFYISTPTADFNYIEIKKNLYNYRKPALISDKALKNCKINGDVIDCKDSMTVAYYNDIYITDENEETFNFNQTNDYLYLGRAYEQTDNMEKALEYYKKIERNDGKHKYFYALYRMAVMNMDETLFLEAYHFNPHRKEPLYYLARMERTRENYSKCLLYARAGMLVGSPSYEELYVENAIYMYAMEEEFALCLYYSGNVEEARLQWKRLFNLPNLPTVVYERIDKNINLF